MSIAAVERKRTAIGLGIHHFHAGRGARRQKCQHGAPVIGWAETETKEVLVLERRLGLPRESPDLSGSSMIGFSNGGVEPSDAPETGSQGNLIHWQIRLVNQLLGK